jgi:hypothetical protein
MKNAEKLATQGTKDKEIKKKQKNTICVEHNYAPPNKQ